MKDFQNRNPLRRQVDANGNADTIEQKKPSVGRGRKISCNILFLLLLVLLLGGIVSHYSRFSTYGEFVLLTEESDTVSTDEEVMEYQRLLVRNRFPFVLTIAVRLCRVEDGETSQRFSVLDTQYYSFVGTRSWYSGAFEARIHFVVSDTGRFTVTDRSGTPLEQLLTPFPNADAKDRDLWSETTVLPSLLANQLVKELRKGKLPGISEIKEDRKIRTKEPIWCCSLPDDHDGKVLVITMSPRANYGR
ncbi:MAG: hypothetical protein FWH27_03285 [Planctomycetaceae bacterium]|nr:hypothetical protein [Planctomycetaceae bacterium]